MPFRSWLFALVLTGFAYSSSAGWGQIVTEDEQGQEERVDDPTNDSGRPSQRNVDLLPAFEALEAAIRGLRPDEDDIERQRRLDAERRDLEAQETMAFWAKWMFYAAVATVFLTLAALLAIVRTLHHTRRAADYTYDMLGEARRATSAVNRAWIKVSATSGSYFIDRQGGITFSVDFEIENVGNTPAMNAHTTIEAVPDYNEARRDAVKLAKQQDGSEFEKTASRIVFANERYTRPWAPTIDGAYFEKRGYMTAVIIGCVSYRTSYDNDLHQTVFVYGVTFEGGDISPQSDNGTCDFFVLPGGFAT